MGIKVKVLRENKKAKKKEELDEAFGLGEMAVAVMVSFGGTRVEIDKNDMKAAEALMQQIENKEEFSGVPSIEIKQSFDRMAHQIKSNSKSKVDDDKDGISDLEANFGIYDPADEIASQIFLRTDTQPAPAPKAEIPATHGIGDQSATQKNLFQRMMDKFGLSKDAPPATKAKTKKKSKYSKQKQVRDAVRDANKKSRKKMMDL